MAKAIKNGFFCNNSKKQVFIFAIIIKTDKDKVKIIVFKKGHFSH